MGPRSRRASRARAAAATALLMAVGCGDDGGAAGDSGVPPMDAARDASPRDTGMPPGDSGVPPSVGPDLPIPTPLAVYYVSSSLGDDAWSGTMPEPSADGSDGPKATLGAAAALLAAASPGTHVLLRRGDTWDAMGSVEIGGAAGTPDAPILLGAYGEGAQPHVVSHTQQTIVVRGASDRTSAYFRMDDIRLTSASPAEGQIAVYTGESFHPEPPHHLTFSKLTIENNGGGMTLYGDGHLVHGCRIANNNLGMGIYVTGNDLVFQYNELENNGLPPPDVFVHSMYVSACNGVRFENNLVHSATDGVKFRRTSNAVIRNNTFHDILALGIHLGGDSEGGASNNRIESNLFYRNSSDIVIKSESGTQVELLDGLVIANNIMRDGIDDFVDYGSHVTVVNDIPARNVSVVNNLVYDGGNDGGITIMNDGSDIVCANNVVGQFSGQPAYRLAPSVMESDDLSFDSPAAFDALGLEDPASGDFTITTSSTMLIDRGTDVSAVLDADFVGVARPQGPAFDIGPYELVP